MRKYLKITLLFGVLAFFSTASYLIYTVSPREFFHEGMTFTYINENIKNKNLDEAIDFLADQGVPVDRAAFKKFQKSVNSLYILEDESLLNPQRDPLVIIDTGFRYYLYLMKIEKYFETSGDAYLLRGEFIESLGLGKMGVEKLFMYPYRGNFLFSTNSRKIHRAIDERTSVGDNTAEFFDRQIHGNLGIASFNLKKDKIFGINTFTGVFDYRDGELNSEFILYLRETEMKENQPVGRDTLARYIKKNRVYLNIPEYVKIFEIGRRFIIKDKKMEFLLGFWQTILGIDIPAILSDIDSEIVYDLESANGMVKFGETDRIAELVKSLENRTVPGIDYRLKLVDNYLIIGEEELDLNENRGLDLKDNQIIYFEGDNAGERIEIEAFNLRKIIKIFVKLNDEALKSIIKKNLRKEGSEDDKNI